MKKIFFSLLLFINAFCNAQNIDSLKTVLTKNLNDTTRAKTLNLLTEIINDVELVKYNAIYEQFINEKLQQNNTEKEKIFYLKQNINVLSNKSVIAFNQKNLFDAIKYTEASLKICEDLGLNKEIAANSRNLATVYLNLGKKQIAINYHNKALEICKKIKDTYGEASGYELLGSIYESVNENKMAMEYLQKSISLSKLYNYDKILGTAYNNLAVCYLNLNNLKEALAFSQKSYLIAEKNNSYNLMATCNNLVGSYYFKKKNFDSAIVFFDKNLILGRSTQFPFIIAFALNNLSACYNSKLNFTKALKLSLEAESYCKQLGITNVLVSCYENTRLNYVMLGQKNKAYDYLLLENQTKDSLNSIENINALIRNEAKYDFDKKQLADSLKTASEKQYTAQINQAKLSKERNQKLLYASIALLALLSVGFVFYQYKLKQKTNAQLNDINDKINKQNNTLKTLNKELIESEESLQKSNSTKEQLISMMSHDLLNPITAITNYNQQIISSHASTNSTTSEDLLSAFKNVDAAIQPMHNLLDNMLHWSAIQKEGVQAKLKQQDVNEIIKEIISIYRPQASLKFIKLNDKLDADFILETDKSILSLILRNVLNNAIKYSGNNTQIQIASNTQQKTITVSDEGFGMTDEMINYLNTKQLTKIDSKGSGLGLKLCFEFAEAINTNLAFSNNEKTGIMVTIKLCDA